MPDDCQIVVYHNSDENTAGYFSRYFSLVFTMEDNLNYLVSTSMNGDEADITCEDLYIDLTWVLSPRPFHDLDETKQWDLMSYQPNYLLKYRTRLLIPLLLLFKKSLSESSIPQDWKQANVTPIFK